MITELPRPRRRGRWASVWEAICLCLAIAALAAATVFTAYVWPWRL